MLVGEQPCDREDLTGKPFVGPGHILDRALAEAGVRRGEAFVTNAVKYFKYELRGKRRLHKPSRRGRDRGMPLVVDIERRLIRPGVIVALGASAARGVLGRPVTIAKACDLIETLADGTPVRVTIHPSLFQRLRTENEKHAEYELYRRSCAPPRHWPGWAFSSLPALSEAVAALADVVGADRGRGIVPGVTEIGEHRGRLPVVERPAESRH